MALHFIKSQLIASFNMLWMISGDNMDDYIMKHVYTSSTSSAHYVLFNAAGAETANMVWISLLMLLPLVKF